MCAIFTGKRLIYLEEVNSTNSYLSALAAQEKVVDGTVVLAAHQLAGKGQRGNVWQAEKGKNLTFSIYYSPAAMRISKQFLLTQAISLGVYDYLCLRCTKVKIKWPNDLYVNDKKIGGMLIENSIKGELISQVVIGIGLNINQETFDASLQNATSLYIENKKIYNLEDECKTLLSYVERRYLSWLNGNHAVLKEQYLNVIYRYKSWHTYKLPNGSVLEGMITGLEETGQLLVQDPTGVQHSFANQEIMF